jgi:hypothetical protein
MKKKYVIVFTLILLLTCGMIGTDFHMAQNDKPPVFALQTSIYKDGGTKVFTGLGYSVIDYNQLEGRKDVAFIPLYIKKWEIKNAK